MLWAIRLYAYVLSVCIIFSIQDGFTVLHIATQKGSVDLAKMFLSNGVNADAETMVSVNILGCTAK